MSEALSNLGSENRTFAPTEAFASQANAKQEIYERADKDYLAFWEEQASALYWHKKWDRVLDWQSPFYSPIRVSALLMMKEATVLKISEPTTLSRKS